MSAATSKKNGRTSRTSPVAACPINLVLILITLIVAIAAWVTGAFIYSEGMDFIPRPLLIGIIFLCFYLILVIVIYLYSNAAGIFERNVLWGERSTGTAFRDLMVLAIIVFAAAVAFQWIYGLNVTRRAQEATSYIFIIDDSGSMEGNDPEQLRYSALDEVLDDMDDDFQYMVYGFSSEVEILSDMQTVSDGVVSLSGENYGGTSIRGALTQVIEDYENGVWDGGDAPKVILLTDGGATDIGIFHPINKVLRKYARYGISISTVGLGYADDNLMNQIAKATGGVYIDVSDAEDLGEAMKTAASQYTSRDLLSARYVPSLDVLYGIMRVVFLFLLGSAIGVGAMVAYGRLESCNLMLISTAVKSLLGALVMEIGIDVVGISDQTAWFILWLLIGVTLATNAGGYSTGARSRNSKQQAFRFISQAPHNEQEH